MDFSLLPDHVFLQIFQYLPLEECVQAGRVNKKFHRIAQLAIFYTKSLDLNESRFRDLTADQLAIILDLCAPNLEQIKFPSSRALKHQAQQLASIFPDYQCPRLTDIDLGHALIDFTDFDRLVRNIPKLESLVWHANFVGFPNITNYNLKKLDLRINSDASLQSLIGRCPNLQGIDLNVADDNDITANVLDEFFASIPRVHRVNLQNERRQNRSILKLESTLVNFWNLSLTSLRLSFMSWHYPDDNLFYMVAKSFPNLQKFCFSSLVEPTDVGIAYLGYLQELEVIDLYFLEPGQSRYDEGIHQLVSCKKLRKFGMDSSYISSGSFVHLLHSCSQLKEIDIWSISDIDSLEEAASILESLAGIQQREITINICSRGPGSYLDWDAEPIKVAIKLLGENFGLKIKIDGPWREWMQ